MDVPGREPNDQNRGFFELGAEAKRQCLRRLANECLAGPFLERFVRHCQEFIAGGRWRLPGGRCVSDRSLSEVEDYRAGCAGRLRRPDRNSANER